MGKWGELELYANGKTSPGGWFNRWSVTKDNKVCLKGVPRYDSEKNEWEAKETLYELSEDGKTLKHCDDGIDANFVEKQGLCWIINSELPGAIVTMHDYLAGVVKDEIEAKL